MKIVIIQTGGTIDKTYPMGEDHHGYGFAIDEPAAEVVLDKVTPEFDYEILSVLRKDSIDMNDKDREKVREAVKGVKEKMVVITHGTDTIAKTAEVLKDVKGKTIVLTGAMLPEKFYESEADFNVGMAIASVQNLPEGVYVALQGVVNKVSK